MMKTAELVALLEIHWKGNTDVDVGTRIGAIDQLLRMGLISISEDLQASCTAEYHTTAKGMRFAEMLCATPLPERDWRDPRV